MLDQLEGRCLLAVNLGLDGVLRISGDFKKNGSPKDDRVVIFQDFFSGFTVVQNAETFGPFDTSFVSAIEIDTGAGNDKILCRNGDQNPVLFPVLLLGGRGNDTIEGGDNSDVISGGSGKDSLAGGLGGDSLFGGPGDDRLNGSLFAVVPIGEFDDDGDLLDGGSGRDIADYSTRLESVYVSNDDNQAGDDAGGDGAFGSSFPSADATTTEFDNVLATCENILGGFGNDCLVGAFTSSLLDGGPGDDFLYGETGNDTVFGGQGNDVIAGGNGFDSLFGGPGADSIYGDFRFLSKGPFSVPVFDTLFGFADDTMDGGDGDDFIQGGGDSFAFLNVGSGNDMITGGIGSDTLLGDDGDDRINAGAGIDILFGDIGNDTMLGGNDDDILLNRSSNFGFNDFDFVDGGDGFDIAEAELGIDTQPVPATIEFFLEASILDTPSGSAPQGVSEFGGASAAAATKIITISGTSKNDSISITERDGTISVNVNGKVTNYASGTIRRFTIDTGKGNDFIALQTSKGTNICTVPVSVLAGAGNDVVIGGSRRDTIYGGDGNDQLSGGRGVDSLFGGFGNDTLDGGADGDILNGGQGSIPGPDGADLFIGGSGNDAVDYQQRTGGVKVTMGDNLANDGAANAGEGDNVRSDVENLFGGAGNDKITGNASANLISGGAGNDSIDGLGGSDKLIGLAGRDVIRGSEGTDFFALQDGVRDDFDAPVGDLIFSVPEFIAGDESIDFSFVSQRLFGRSTG